MLNYMVKVGINGFGRIGRIAARIALLGHVNDLEISAINTSGSMNVAGWAHLLTYDTMYRKFSKIVGCEEVKEPQAVSDEDPLLGYLKIEGKQIPILFHKDPSKIP